MSVVHGRLVARSDRRATAAHLRASRVAAIAAALISAALLGVLLARDLPVGIALLLVLAYVPLALSNLALGLALWVPLAFLEALPAARLGPELALTPLLLAWLASLRGRREEVLAVLRRHRRLFVTLAAFGGWLALSLAWAEQPGRGARELVAWTSAILAFVLIVTTLSTAREVRRATVAFVAGALLALLWSPAHASTSGSTRLSGGVGDPNFLAIALVAAIALTAALALGARRNVAVRALCVVVIGVLAAAWVTTESRSGTVAALTMILAAPFVFRRQRFQVVALMAFAVGIAAISFTLFPSAWNRIVNDKSDNGRQDLRVVAWRVIGDHPVIGVGLDNFPVFSPRYVREPGALSDVRQLAETPRDVHNTYLQVWVDTGIVGLVLFVTVMFACLRAAWEAAARFDRTSEPALAGLARAVFIGELGMLTANLFLTGEASKRLWILFALGPALLTVAFRRQALAEAHEGLPAPVPSLLVTRGR